MYKSLVHKKLQHLRNDEPPDYQILSHLTPNQSRTSIDTLKTIRFNDLDKLKMNYNQNIKIDIQLTETPSVIGKEPQILNDDTKEYKEDDYIYGYAIIENTSSERIAFSVLYILLEGVYQYDDKLTHKIISMVDLNASLVNENLPTTQKDPIDQTCIVMNEVLEPHIKYKRFFTFKVPQYILDANCSHFLTNHLYLPPSFGGAGKFRDFGIDYTSIKYSINSYLIGETKEEFIKMGHGDRRIRIIPRNYNSNDPSIVKNYQFFHSRLKQELRIYDKKKYDQMISKLFEIKEGTCNTDLEKTFTVGEVRTKVIISMHEPFTLRYTPPISKHPDVNQQIKIPIKFESASKVKLKSIECELVLVTVDSATSSIPFMIVPDMIFNNSHEDTNFKNIISDPYHKLFKEVKKTLSKNNESFKLGSYLYENIRRMSNLKCVYHELQIDDIDCKVNYDSTQDSQNENLKNKLKNINNRKPNQERKTKSLSIDAVVKLKSMHIKKLDKAVQYNRFGGFTLIPNFQTCYMARLYFIKLILKFSRGKQVIYIPVTIE